MDFEFSVTGIPNESIFSRIQQANQLYIFSILQGDIPSSERVDRYNRFSRSCASFLQEVLAQLTGRQCFLLTGSESPSGIPRDSQLDESDMVWYVDLAAGAFEGISWMITLHDREYDRIYSSPVRLRKDSKLPAAAEELLEEVYEGVLEILEQPVSSGRSVL